jgi:hypothetical protein
MPSCVLSRIPRTLPAKRSKSWYREALFTSGARNELDLPYSPAADGALSPERIS